MARRSDAATCKAGGWATAADSPRVGLRGPQALRVAASGGSYAIDSVRLLLVRWEKRGLLRLPPPKRGQPAARRRPGEADEAVEVDFGRGKPDGRLEVRPITDDERPRWRALMRRHHYLGDGGEVGETIRYVEVEMGKPVALLGWSAAALYNGPRDEYPGWDSATRKRRLHFVANNTRFLILPDARRPHLASQVLAANLRRLSRDWQAAYGHPLFLAETFVDVSRFPGDLLPGEQLDRGGPDAGVHADGCEVGPEWPAKGGVCVPVAPPRAAA